MSTGTVKFGGLAEQQAGNMRLTFAEGQLDGKFAQVFGALRAEPARVPGGLLGIPGSDNPLLRLDLRIEYAGFADFQSVGDNMGEQHLKVRLLSPLLPDTCTIGSNQDPIKFKPIRTSGPDVIFPDPTVLRFTIEDKQYSVPKAHNCRGLDSLVNRRFDLPAAPGTNKMAFTTLVGLKGYKLPHQLSGGEQQRVVIGRALLNDPDIILADEPTGNLDPETSEGIINLLQDISRTGRAVIVATHNHTIIKKFPARTIRCENGKLTEVPEDEPLEFDFKETMI
jgi:hypothetical protein